MANGFANRFLYVLVKRSKELPFGGSLTDSEIQHLGELLKGVIDKAKPIGRMDMSGEARVKLGRDLPRAVCGQTGPAWRGSCTWRSSDGTAGAYLRFARRR